MLIAATLCLGSCIHEYPYATSVDGPAPGKNPETVTAAIEVSYDLSWETMIHYIDFSVETKAPRMQPHRFVIEVKHNGKTVAKDIEYLSEESFLNGRLTHKLSTPLEARDYDIAVWYDKADEEGNFAFDAESLEAVSPVKLSTINAAAMECGYASDVLNLSGIDSSTQHEIRKELQLDHPGARFEIIATDVLQFISEHKEALYQGDTFYVNLDFTRGTTGCFNLFEKRMEDTGKDLQLSGWMRLPYDEYDELKIAEGFLFCPRDSEVTAVLSITNSSLMPVSATGSFSFPVRPGYITVISGDFLTNPIDGVFSIDNIWEGEIEINY